MDLIDVQLSRTNSNLKKTVNLTFVKWILNVNAVLNPTQYTKFDKNTVKINRSKIVRELSKLLEIDNPSCSDNVNTNRRNTIVVIANASCPVSVTSEMQHRATTGPPQGNRQENRIPYIRNI